jgi:hypothetical protein
MRYLVDYEGLVDYAGSRGVKVVEGSGPGLEDGVRVNRAGKEWIVLNYRLSELEKMRTLGFLLESREKTMKSVGGGGMESPMPPAGADYLFSIHCSKS